MAAPIFPDAPYDPRQSKLEMAALVLMALGVIGLVVCAFVWDPLAGFALLSVAALATGVVLASDVWR